MLAKLILRFCKAKIYYMYAAHMRSKATIFHFAAYTRLIYLQKFLLGLVSLLACAYLAQLAEQQ